MKGNYYLLPMRKIGKMSGTMKNIYINGQTYIFVSGGPPLPALSGGGPAPAARNPAYAPPAGTCCCCLPWNHRRKLTRFS